LVEKSDAFNTSKHFKSLVEKENESCIKCLRTDRGGEFTLDEFNLFCKENGIKRQLTDACTPHQNGDTKRKNRTTMNMVKSLLEEKNIPKNFWPEAVNWVVHVLNRSPTLAVKHMTPEEAWSGIKPYVEHFRVFGWVSHVHVPNAKRKKLKDKSFTCVLLGISKESKAYKLYDPISKRIMVSHFIKFEEDKSLDWNNSYKELIAADLEWGEDEGKVVTNNENDEDIEGDSDAKEVETDSSSDLNDVRSPSSSEGRHRRRPGWMDDYESVEKVFLKKIRLIWCCLQLQILCILKKR